MSQALELTIFNKLFAAVAEEMGIVLRESAVFPQPQGAPGENVLITETEEQTLPGKINLTLPAGSRLSIRTPGGGGWGSE
jgi:N-methylhydantoinase B/oxoprolinase/acetone carboxylase alpha subunit